MPPTQNHVLYTAQALAGGKLGGFTEGHTERQSLVQISLPGRCCPTSSEGHVEPNSGYDLGPTLPMLVALTQLFFLGQVLLGARCLQQGRGHVRAS